MRSLKARVINLTIRGMYGPCEASVGACSRPQRQSGSIVQLRYRLVAARVVVAVTCLFAAAGVAVAASESLPASSPGIVLGTTQSDLTQSSGYTGAGTTVAIIDTGIADVPGLAGTVVHQQNISSAPITGDQFGHGTFVAGIVHQIAPAAKIVSVKLSDADGSVDVSQVLAALRWVVRNKDRYSIDVVNLSFGTDSQQPTSVSPLNFAVERAWNAGIVVTASAGNLGDQPGTVTKPGDDPYIITVGASNENGDPQRGNDNIPAFVSRGPTHDGIAKPDLVAPGSRLVSLRAPGSTIDTDYPAARVGSTQFRGSGTSFAAPIVAGLAAQLLQAHPGLSPDQVKYALTETAKPINGDAAAQGTGTVRAQRAIDAAGPTGNTNAAATPSDGSGSLDAARGSARVEVIAPVIDSLGVSISVSVAVDGEHTTEIPADPALAPQLSVGGALSDAIGDFAGADLVAADEWLPTSDDELQQAASLAPILDPLASVLPVTSSLITSPVLTDIPLGTPPPSGTTYGGYDGSASWGASRWGASRWGASRWGASRWGASRWGASRWG
ncbi:MAG: peptidase and in kexin sedolisin, partial [Thermoleophilia bacterium]|nr:peptidase and in kexin sedolisin [Thermoleophilia bacterium]